ncbi:hypothetical protein [Sulfurimonas sp.]|uniref:hypothetical protein n=1 Tax=Sulfurimonas sp. TaxID=2022749 RepID=UPI003568CCE4
MVNKTSILKSLKLLAVTEFVILLTYFYSKSFYANLQVAFISSFIIMLGSFYAHRKMVNHKVKTQNFESDRDPLDTIDDPHELYDEEALNEAPAEELDLKQIVKEEKKKIKTFNLKSLKEGSSASFSLFRLGGYLFLVLGFIALKNNEILQISVYLPSLLIGIIVGYICSKEIFS